MSDMITQGRVPKWVEGKDENKCRHFWDKMGDKDSEEGDENEEWSGKWKETMI